MKKADRFRKNSKDDEKYEPMFEDSSYQQDYRVDPLTTRDRIKQELADMEQVKRARAEMLAAEAAKKQAEKEAKEEMERNSEIVKRSETVEQ